MKTNILIPPELKDVPLSRIKVIVIQKEIELEQYSELQFKNHYKKSECYFCLKNLRQN